MGGKEMLCGCWVLVSRMNTTLVGAVSGWSYTSPWPSPATAANDDVTCSLRMTLTCVGTSVSTTLSKQIHATRVPSVEIRGLAPPTQNEFCTGLMTDDVPVEKSTYSRGPGPLSLARSVSSATRVPSPE